MGCGGQHISEKPLETFDVQRIREDFPILSREVYNKPLVYLDNAATSQKPRQVIDAISDYYARCNSNIHRGLHYLSDQATHAYEQARETVREFINAPERELVNFVRGTTEGVNLVANAWGRKFLKPGDEVILTEMEHHANIVPWYRICEEKGCKLRVIPLLEDGSLDMEAYRGLLNEKTRMVSLVHTSNTLGTVNPVREIIRLAHEAGALSFVDAAQAIPHGPLDVQELDCDFLAFSGHKAYGPTGIGVLYGKRELLEAMDPFMGGGEMIDKVSFEKITYNRLPYKFEAGTPNIAGGIALAEALKYMRWVGFENIRRQEQALLEAATEQLGSLPGIRIYGTAPGKASVISFLAGKLHAFDVGTLLDKFGVAIRTGHHCTQPIMDHYGIDGTCRASFAFYNTLEEVGIFVRAVDRAMQMLS